MDTQILMIRGTTSSAGKIPGSKRVRVDLNWLRQHGWELAIRRHLRYGGKLMGICGGFQMLGKLIHDPNGFEGDAGSAQGFAYFDMETTLHPDKLLHNTQGILAFNDATITGYEIHTGITTYHTSYPPAIHLTQGDDGAISDDKLILGTS